MNREIIWSPASEKDFVIILDYLIERWSENVVSKFINKVDDNINLICENPKIFPVINKEMKIRKSVITKQNTLFYREIDGKVEIVRLFNTRQNPKKLKL